MIQQLTTSPLMQMNAVLVPYANHSKLYFHPYVNGVYLYLSKRIGKIPDPPGFSLGTEESAKAQRVG
jgi:hypothetical protein